MSYTARSVDRAWPPCRLCRPTVVDSNLGAYCPAIGNFFSETHPLAFPIVGAPPLREAKNESICRGLFSECDSSMVNCETANIARLCSVPSTDYWSENFVLTLESVGNSVYVYGRNLEPLIAWPRNSQTRTGELATDAWYSPRRP